MDSIRFCKKHGECEHVLSSGKWRCKKCRSEAVQKRRDKIKLMSIEYKGGKCEICGYDKCPDAMEFHHLNPHEKDFGIAEKGYTRSFDKVKEELDKCILICSNCHREIHYNLRDKQTDVIRNEIVKETKPKKQKLKTIKLQKKNVLCEKIKRISVKKNTPQKEEVISLLRETKNFSMAGRIKNVSDNAVRKWCKKYGIPTHIKEALKYINNLGE